METIKILRAIYNDKGALKKIHKSINEYALNLKSLEQLKNDSKEIEVYIKETYGLSATVFKKIVKATMEQNKKADDIIDELVLIHDIASESISDRPRADKV